MKILYTLSIVLLLLLLNIQRTSAIAGGDRDEEKMQFVKHMVSIRTRTAWQYFGDNHFCGGTIIAPNIILTAAHCVMDKRKVLTPARRMLVVAGTPNRLEIASTTELSPVDYVQAHPHYMLYNKDDIALIFLKNNLSSDNPAIKTMQLPTATTKPNSTCFLLGWGRMFWKGPLSAKVFSIEVRLFPEDECRKAHPKFTAGALCASNDEYYTKDPCRGDSGGPLVCNGVLTGVISYTIACGSVLFPSLYTDIYQEIKWIKSIVNKGPETIFETTFSKQFSIFVLTFLTFFFVLN